MQKIYQLVVFLHILAAIIWIGGMVFLSLVVVPIARRPGFREQAMEWIGAVGHRFRYIGWICFVVLVVTGIYSLYVRGWLSPELIRAGFWDTALGQVMSFKIMLVLLVVFLSLAHDFWMGPRVAKLWKEHPGSPEAIRARKMASWFGRLTLLIALVIVVCAVMVVRGVPV